MGTTPCTGSALLAWVSKPDMGDDSLFGSDTYSDSSESEAVHEARVCTCVPLPCTAGQDARQHIPGLHLFPALLPLELQEEILCAVLDEQALTSEHPQAMLFPRSSGPDVETCPPFLAPLVARLPELLDGLLSPNDYATVFDETKPLQTILNLYEPGKGITPHVRPVLDTPNSAGGTDSCVPTRSTCRIAMPNPL